MPADANIFQAYLRPPKSIMQYQDEADQAQSRRNALQMAAMDLSDKTQANQGRAAVRNALQRLAPDATDDQRIASLRGTGTQEGLAAADALQKTLIEQQKSASEVKKNDATTGHLGAQTADQVYKTRMAKSDQAIKDISAFNSPQEALVSLQKHEAAGDIDPQKAAEIRAGIPQDPAQFPRWQLGMLKNIMAAKDQLALTVPDANATLQAQTSTSNNAATNATSRANNAATIKKDLTVAGLNNDGTSNGNDDAMIDAIGQYKIAPPNGMAMRNPRMQQILAKVAEKYPEFDATSYGARQTAAKSFSTGKDAQNVQSANTALNHLDTIEQLALAQKNGNMVLFNQIANKIAANTGQAAPTNLNAAISMVAPELTKAVVGTGGGVGERAHFAENLNPNGSPDQILGGLATIKELMGGRLSEVERTYGRSTGRKDFRESFLSPAAQKIMAARAAADGAAAPTVPPDIAAILDKHGKK